MSTSKDSSTDYLLSVIIPFLNESSDIHRVLDNLKAVFPDSSTQVDGRKLSYEFIFVDGGSVDETAEIIQSSFQDRKIFRMLESKKGRAKQMNAGAFKAKGDSYLFLHADTLLPSTVCNELMSFFVQNEKVWGSFSVEFDDKTFPFICLAWMINRRSELTQVVTGDQAIFVKRETFGKLGGFPDIPLMEDVAITKELKKYSKGFRSLKPVITSSRRWKKNGLLKTIMFMWFLRMAYVLGVSPERLSNWYYPNV